MSPRGLTVCVLVILTTGPVAPAALVVAVSLNGTAVLPCTYSAETTTMCWGRDGCPNYWCNNEIIRTDGRIVTGRKSDRYKLLGNISQGNVSLTITGVTKDDEGTYCCRVEIPGPFNDIKLERTVKIRQAAPKPPEPTHTTVHTTRDHEPPYATPKTTSADPPPFNVKRASQTDIVKGKIKSHLQGSSFSPWSMSSYIIAERLLPDSFMSKFDSDIESFFKVEARPGEVVTGSVNGTLTLPCTYKGRICWERGGCSLSVSKCDNWIIQTDGQTVTSKKPDRYQLLEDISQGNMSLTIIRATKEDEGTYCCRTEIDSIFAKQQGNEVVVQITDPEVRALVTLRSETIQPTIPKTTQPTSPKTTQPTSPKTTQPTIPKASQPISPKTTTDPSTTEVMTKSLDVGGRKTAPIGNIIRGILIVLLPILFLLIFKCCSL